MLGIFDENDGCAKVVLRIKGTRSAEKEIIAMFDTGHSGSLSLPLLDLIDIGAKLSSVGEATLADGFKKPQLYFSVKVMVDGTYKKVEAAMIENSEAREAIAGIELFADYFTEIDFKNRTIKFTKQD